jgi:signal transduction histidine kinase
MLRTRLYLGLLPLLLVAIGMGAYAILVSRQLAGSFQRDLVATYRASLAGERMRAAAVRLDGVAANLERGDPLAARRAFEDDRAAFTRELMAQSASAAGTARAPLVAGVDQAFQRLLALDEGMLAAGADRSLEALRQNEDVFYRVIAAIEALERYDYAAAETIAAGADSLAARTVHILLAATAVALALSLFLAWGLTTAAGKVLRAQRTMEAMLTSAPDPVFVFSRDGAREARNPAAERLAQSPDFGPTLPAVLAEPLERALASGQHYLPADYGRAIMLRMGREDRHYLPRILAIGDELTAFKGAAVIFQDVTKFRLLDDAKTNLVGTVSHELKTPLTSLRLAIYLLVEQRLGPVPAAQLEVLETARDEADRLLRIIDDLLDLARLESGSSALALTEVRVADLLAEMAREARPHLAAAGQTLEVRGGESAGSLRVDVDRLRHVFLNLLTNAAKYAPAGTTVTLYAEAAPLGFVRCGVRDEGPGIPPEAAHNIFDRFYRLPGSRRQGAGLGLAIAREIVTAHGGTIAWAPRPGGGSDFYFELPGNSFTPPVTMEA